MSLGACGDDENNLTPDAAAADAAPVDAAPATPDYFGDYASAFVEAGVSIIGGCCGTSDAHIAAMRDAIDQ